MWLVKRHGPDEAERALGVGDGEQGKRRAVPGRPVAVPEVRLLLLQPCGIR